MTAKQILLRAGVGILLLGLGSQFWGRSLLFGLICWGVGVGIGIPWGLGRTLSLDRITQRGFFPEGLEQEEVIAHFTSQSNLKGTEPEAFVLSERLIY